MGEPSLRRLLILGTTRHLTCQPNMFNAALPSHLQQGKGAQQKLGVARRLLQERPLQFQNGNVRVKSWQPMSNSWSTFSQPDFVQALARRKTVREIASWQDFVHRVAQKLANSWSTPRQLLVNPLGSCRGLPCNSPLATPEKGGTGRKEVHYERGHLTKRISGTSEFF